MIDFTFLVNIEKSSDDRRLVAGCQQALTAHHQFEIEVIGL